jgi:chromosome segregation ATPase
MSDGTNQRVVGALHDEVGKLRTEVASLTAERDRLRADLAEDDKKWDRVIDQISTASARVMRERDAALASLTAERERIARMRAVVEAARAVAEAEQHQGRYSAKQHWERAQALIEAVDALDAGAATGGEDGA